MSGCNTFTIKVIQISCSFIFVFITAIGIFFYLLVSTPETLFFVNLAFLIHASFL